MGSVDKQQKLSEGVDRLSGLPSCVISHILSFLPTKYAVGTSILSTKWKNNWKSITNVDFDDSISEYESTDGMHASFVSFVYRVLLQLKSSPLNKFRLCSVSDLTYDDASHLNSWVSAALLHHAQEIEIDRISAKKTCFLPSDLFKCQTLVVLKLFWGTVKVPNPVCLPNLKVLDLQHIEFYDEESIIRLLSSSLVLEDLTLESCMLADISLLNISSSRLKKLILEGCCIKEMAKSRFVLDAPQLEYLEFSGYSPETCTLKNLHSLVEAYIHFNWEIDVAEESLPKVFGDLKSKSPVFLKLKRLDYGLDVYGCSLLKDMVESSPRLETLLLCFACSVPLEKITASICNRLKVVELSWFEGNSEDLEFVKHILKNAKVLERLEIYSTSADDHEEELLAFPRASTSCEVVFYEGNRSLLSLAYTRRASSSRRSYLSINK